MPLYYGYPKMLFDRGNTGRAKNPRVQEAEELRKKTGDRFQSKSAQDAEKSKLTDRPNATLNTRNGEEKGTNLLDDVWNDLFRGEKGEDLSPSTLNEKWKNWSNKGKNINSVASKAGEEVNLAQLAKAKDSYYNLGKKNYIATLTTPHALYGIGGMPASFLPNTDPPTILNPNGVGYTYLTHNVTYGNYIVFQPGYLQWALSGEKIMNIISNPSAAAGTIAQLFTGNLVSNMHAVDTYYQDVERACRVAIYMMGISTARMPFAIGGQTSRKPKAAADRKGNQMAGGKGAFGVGAGSSKVNTYHFNQMTRWQWRSIGVDLANVIANKNLSDIMTPGEAKEEDLGVVPFFVDGSIDVVNQLTSSTADNPMKEALGAMGTTSDLMKMVIGNVGLSNNPIKDSAIAFFTGQPLMPQIWQSSTFDKSYSCTIKLASHSGHPVSIFMNVIYPLIKLSLLALPLGIGGFQTSPPILRVFSLGSINTEYGLITSFNVAKNMESLTDLGMPSEITIQLNIADLNPFLYKEKPGWFSKSVELSTGFSNWLATIIGINITTIGTGARQTWNKEMKSMDSTMQGNLMRENGIFAFQNFKDTIASFIDGSNSKDGRGLNFTDVRSRIYGLFGGQVKGGMGFDNGNKLDQANDYRAYNRANK